MSRMCRFVERDTKVIVFVNAHLVRAVRPHQTQGTQIVFDDSHTVAVVEQAEEVVKVLDSP